MKQTNIRYMKQNSNYEQMLALCYELEGLLALSLERKETTPDMVVGMITEKAKRLSAMASMSPVESVSADSDAEKEAAAVQYEQAEDACMTCQPEPEPVAAAQPVNKPEPVAKPAPMPVAEPKRAEVKEQAFAFTLNDKFRFRRELFGGSDADFADALQVAEAMTSREEVEDYFFNDLCWNPANEDVVAFMDIITARFAK